MLVIDIYIYMNIYLNTCIIFEKKTIENEYKMFNYINV